MVKIFGSLFGKTKNKNTTQNVKNNTNPSYQNTKIDEEKQKVICDCQCCYGKSLVNEQYKKDKINIIRGQIEHLNNENKQERLNKAGFTPEVIKELKEKNTFYAPELIDEVLDMADYLNIQYEFNRNITKDLVEDVIDACSPYASGGSATMQRSILANIWVHGDEIYKAYGQQPPIRTKKIENLSPEEKQEKLNKAGFTKDVIDELKAKSTFYGPELVEEALNMAIYLDEQYEAGNQITKKLVDDVINAFAPGASGGSANSQIQMLACTWIHGEEIYKAYK